MSSTERRSLQQRPNHHDDNGDSNALLSAKLFTEDGRDYGTYEGTNFHDGDDQAKHGRPRSLKGSLEGGRADETSHKTIVPSAVG